MPVAERWSEQTPKSLADLADTAKLLAAEGTIDFNFTKAQLVAYLDTLYGALDGDLTAIAALTTTAFGRSLLELADAAAGRTTLSVDSSDEVDSKIDADVATHTALTSGAHGLPDTSTLLVDGDIGVSVQAYDADTAKLDVEQTFTGEQTFQSGASVGESSGFTPLVLSRYSGNANAQGFRYIKGRGTKASPSQVLSGDQIARFMATAVTSSGLPSAGNTDDFLECYATEDQTPTTRGRDLRLKTIATGTAVSNTVIRVLDSYVGVNNLAPNEALDVTGNIKISGVLYLGTYTVSTLPTATVRGFIFVSDETGGATTAFSDGTNWRRSQDRAIVS